MFEFRGDVHVHVGINLGCIHDIADQNPSTQGQSQLTCAQSIMLTTSIIDT